MIQIKNDGPEIISSNYWETNLAKRGALHLSISAGAFRLLVPENYRAMISQLFQDQKSQYAIVSRGLMEGFDAYEIMVEDGSKDPFAVHMGLAQADRAWLAEENGRTDLVFSAWGPGCRKLGEMPARYRVVTDLPSLKPWG